MASPNLSRGDSQQTRPTLEGLGIEESARTRESGRYVRYAGLE